MVRDAHAMRAGGAYAVRRLVISAVILALIAGGLLWWVTDGFRQQNWRDIIEWHEYQREQTQL